MNDDDFIHITIPKGDQIRQFTGNGTDLLFCQKITDIYFDIVLSDSNLILTKDSNITHFRELANHFVLLKIKSELVDEYDALCGYLSVKYPFIYKNLIIQKYNREEYMRAVNDAKFRKNTHIDFTIKRISNLHNDTYNINDKIYGIGFKLLDIKWSILNNNININILRKFVNYNISTKEYKFLDFDGEHTVKSNFFDDFVYPYYNNIKSDIDFIKLSDYFNMIHGGFKIKYYLALDTSMIKFDYSDDEDDTLIKSKNTSIIIKEETINKQINDTLINSKNISIIPKEETLNKQIDQFKQVNEIFDKYLGSCNEKKYPTCINLMKLKSKISKDDINKLSYIIGSLESQKKLTEKIRKFLLKHKDNTNILYEARRKNNSEKYITVRNKEPVIFKKNIINKSASPVNISDSYIKNIVSLINMDQIHKAINLTSSNIIRSSDDNTLIKLKNLDESRDNTLSQSEDQSESVDFSQSESMTESEDVSLNMNKPQIKKLSHSQVKKEVWKTWCGDSDIGTCFCCCKEIKHESVYCEFGHVIPKSKKGRYTVDNIRPICADCNRGKGGMHDMNMYLYIIKHNKPGVKNLTPDQRKEVEKS